MPLQRSDRVGRDNRIFKMPKFRTMRTDTPQVATHLLTDPDRWLTPVGRFLRKTSLDELPQLWSILMGKMSFVGPRPALFNQDDLVAMRTSRGVHRRPISRLKGKFAKRRPAACAGEHAAYAGSVCRKRDAARSA